MEAIDIDHSLINFGGAIKALTRDGDTATVGGIGVLFGNSRQTDLVGDWFTGKTYLGAHRGTGVDTMLHHGIPLSDDLKKYSDMWLPATLQTEDDDHGLLVKTVLDLRDAYQRKIYDMVGEDLLSWSGGAPSHMVRRASAVKFGEILRWPLSEFSYTPTPCEPRMTHIMPLKALFSDAAYIESDTFRAAVKCLAIGPPVSRNVPLDIQPAAITVTTQGAKCAHKGNLDNDGKCAECAEPVAKEATKADKHHEAAAKSRATESDDAPKKSLDLSNYSPDSIDDVTGAIEGILRARMSVEMQSAGVRAALKVFLSRMDELAAERSSSRKSGAVLSQANYQRLCDHRDAAGQMRDVANAMHDDLHDMVTTYQPASMQDKDQDQDPAGKAVDMAAVEGHRQALRVAVARAGLRLVA